MMTVTGNYITELSGIVYGVEGNGPRRQPWGRPHEMGSADNPQSWPVGKQFV